MDRLRIRLGAGTRARLERFLPLALYAAITLLVTMRHEPWRDEADTWLYARDADLETIVGRLRYMGTPGLWYLLLFPLAKLGLPYAAQAGLHYGLAVVAAGLFFLLAPLPRLTKLLFVFSYFMAYEYVVVARSYVLTVLLLFAAAVAYRRRLERPLGYGLVVALLYHTNAHSLGIAATLSAAYAWDVIRRRPIEWAQGFSVLLQVGSAALALALLAPPPDPNVAPGGAPQLLVAPVTIAGAFLPGLDAWVGMPVGVLTLVAVGGVLARSPQAVFLLAGSWGWLLYVFVFRYSGSLRHHGLLLIVLIFAVWIAGTEDSAKAAEARGHPRRRYAFWPLNLALSVSVAIAAIHWQYDYAQAYSAAPEMAAYLRREGLTERAIAAHRPSHGEALLPHLPGVRLWYIGLGESGTYMPWDRSYAVADKLTFEDAVERFAQMPRRSADALLLLNEPLPEAYRDRFRLVYETRSTVFYHRDEAYYLYEQLT